MKILVTGATGYAGFHAAIALRQAGHQVYGLVRDRTKPRAKKLQRYEVQLAFQPVFMLVLAPGTEQTSKP